MRWPATPSRPISEAHWGHLVGGEVFALKRDINGLAFGRRLAMRRGRSKPLVEALETWMRAERRKLSSKSPLAKAFDYMLKRWPAFARFLDDGRICMTNNAAERAVRGIAVGHRNWTFCGSDTGGQRVAVFYTLIETAKLNDLDPKARLTDVLAHIADHPMNRIAELLLWNWKTEPKGRSCINTEPPYRDRPDEEKAKREGIAAGQAAHRRAVREG